MSEELKPCPFCGSTNLEDDVGLDEARIVCADCDCFGPTLSNMSEAVIAWNTRQEKEA
jgi:Lar family restriction alleviation protein